MSLCVFGGGDSNLHVESQAWYRGQKKKQCYQLKTTTTNNVWEYRCIDGETLNFPNMIELKCIISN